MATRKRGKGRSTGGAPLPGIYAGLGRSTAGAPFTPSEIDAIQARATKGAALREARGGALGGALDHAPFVPCRLKGGEPRPLPEAQDGESRGEKHRIILTDAGPKIVLLQRPLAQEKVVIDYLSFTVDESILRRIIPPEVDYFSDEQYLNVWGGYVAKALLCLDCNLKPRRSGLFGYDATARVGDYGLVGAGGTHSSLYCQLSGHAFASADEKFPQRLFDFLKQCRSHNITRIDLAYDDFTGEVFPVREMVRWWHEGRFTSQFSPVPPKIKLDGDWHRDDPMNKGLTYYVGSRDSGKLFRCYEKGKQLGDKSSTWNRAEVELLGSVFHLIPEMLLSPTSYFVALYPALAAIEYAGVGDRVERIAREGVDSVQKILDTIRHQYGGYLHVLRDEFFGRNDTELLEQLCRVPKEVPAVLRKAINLSDALESATPTQPSSMADSKESSK